MGPSDVGREVRLPAGKHHRAELSGVLAPRALVRLRMVLDEAKRQGLEGVGARPSSLRRGRIGGVDLDSEPLPRGASRASASPIGGFVPSLNRFCARRSGTSGTTCGCPRRHAQPEARDVAPVSK